jgi:hypothetical protein
MKLKSALVGLLSLSAVGLGAQPASAIPNGLPQAVRWLQSVGRMLVAAELLWRLCVFPPPPRVYFGRPEAAGTIIGGDHEGPGAFRLPSR